MSTRGGSLNLAHSAVNTVDVVGDSEGKSTRPARLVLWLAFLPPLILGLLILKYGVDVIDWDQWEIAALFEKASRGALTLSDLFAQQAEFRQFFPNLIFLGLGSITRWNVRYEMLVTFSLACLVAVNLYKLARATLEYSDSTQYAIAFITSLLVFAPAQFENWLRGEQIIYLMPIACLTTALRVAYSKSGTGQGTLICMVLATVATFSSSNGFVCWIVLAPVLFSGSTRPNWLVFVWVGVFILELIVYLYGYRTPSYSPPLGTALRHPLDAIFFFIALLGAPLLTVYRLAIVGCVIGIILVASTAIAWYDALKVRTDDTRQVIPWLMLGAYSLITALVVTVARVGYGADKAFSSRYGGFFVYLAVSLAWLFPRILADLRQRGWLRRDRFWRVNVEMLVLAGFIPLHIANSSYAIFGMRAMRTRILQDKACYLFVNVVQDECLSRRLPGRDIVWDRTNAMDKLGYLRPRPVASNRISDIAASDTPEAYRSGRFESLTRLADGSFVARGVAILPGRGDPADAVVLTYEDGTGQSIIFALGEPQDQDHSFGGSSRDAANRASLWQKRFSAPAIPAAGPVRISMWAFDALKGKAYRMEGSHIIASGVAPR